MPGAIEFEGEHAGTASRVPIGGVNNCAEKRERVKDLLLFYCVIFKKFG